MGFLGEKGLLGEKMGRVGGVEEELGKEDQLSVPRHSSLGFSKDSHWESKVWARDAQEAAKGLRTPLGIHGSSPQSGIGLRKKHP